MPSSALLWLILGLTLVTTAMSAPLVAAMREEINSAKRKLRAYMPMALTARLLSVVALVLWWLYAIRTDQILLAVIPTVAWIWGALMQGFLRFLNTEGAR